MADSEPAPLNTSALSYEEARDMLIEVVNRLEQGGTTLEESLQLWEKGQTLAERCEQWLLGARKRLENPRTHTQDNTDDTGTTGNTTGNNQNENNNEQW